jgi:tryptophan synthase alpha chain
VKVTTPALVVYLMAGDDTPELAAAAVRGGATAIEFGIPYSDPLADGPTIQRAGQRALDAGMTPPRALEVLRAVDGAVDVPLIPMTYGAIIESYGRERFCADAAAAGTEGLIVVDVPPEESGAVRDAAAAAGIDLIHLVAPTSRDERLRAAAGGSRGFVYLVAAMGTTGARERLDDRLAGLIGVVKRAAGPTPVLAGFGISRPEHVRAVLDAGADGVVVGSAAIEAADRGGAPALEEFVRSLKEAMA